MNAVIMCCPGREAAVGLLREKLAGHAVLEVWDAQREGALICASRAFDLAADVFKGKPVTILQDDVTLCKNFGAFVDSVDVKRPIQWLAHGLHWKDGDEPTFRFLKHFNGQHFLTSVAMTYPAEIVQIVADGLKLAVTLATTDDLGRKHGDDKAIGDILAWNGINFDVHVPSLVQHADLPSLVAPGTKSTSHPARTSRCFVGTSFDAATLIPKKETPTMDKDTPEKTIGEMTMREFWTRLQAIEGEETADDGQRLLMQHAQSLPDLPGKVYAPDARAVLRDAADPMCATCGAFKGNCPHAE